jgi:hypothetical protein
VTKVNIQNLLTYTPAFLSQAYGVLASGIGYPPPAPSPVILFSAVAVCELDFIPKDQIKSQCDSMDAKKVTSIARGLNNICDMKATGEGQSSS